MPMLTACLAALLLAVVAPWTAAGTLGVDQVGIQQFAIDDSTYQHIWRVLKDMPTKRSDMSATTVGEAVYLVGGCIGDQEWSASASMYLCSGATGKTEKYLLATNTYETLADAPRTRYRHAAAAIGSQLYLFGGCDIADNLIAQVDVLDTLTGKWSTLEMPMPNPTSDNTAFVFGNKIYAIGGYNRPDYLASQSMQIFDPTKSGSAQWSQGSKLVKGRGDMAATVVDGSAYIFGGFHDSNWSAPLASLESLDLSAAAAAWTTRATAKVGRGDFAMVGFNHVLHIVGGESKNEAGESVPLMDVAVYSPAKDTWYAGGSIHSHRFRFVGAADGSSIYLFGGQGFMAGSYGAAGSKYPVLASVEQYKEEVIVGINHASASAGYLGVVAALVLQATLMMMA